MLAIARELVRRGHRVRWLAGAAFRERVEGTGASFCAFDEGFDYSCPPQCQQRSPLGLTRPPGGQNDDHATAL